MKDAPVVTTPFTTTFVVAGTAAAAAAAVSMTAFPPPTTTTDSVPEDGVTVVTATAAADVNVVVASSSLSVLPSPPPWYTVIGQLVSVSSRTSPGINQPGGIGRITTYSVVSVEKKDDDDDRDRHHHPNDSDSNTTSSSSSSHHQQVRVSVKYVLDGRHEKKILIYIMYNGIRSIILLLLYSSSRKILLLRAAVVAPILPYPTGPPLSSVVIGIACHYYGYHATYVIGVCCWDDVPIVVPYVPIVNRVINNNNSYDNNSTMGIIMVIVVNQHNVVDVVGMAIRMISQIIILP
jgi:hypothetical protein